MKNRQRNFMKILLVHVIIWCAVSTAVTAQEERAVGNKRNRLISEVDKSSLLIGYQSNGTNSLQIGYNLLFNSEDSWLDFIWDKFTLAVGYAPTLKPDLFTASAGFAHTTFFLVARTDFIASFSGGLSNYSINPKIGIDLLLAEFYIGYNHYFIRNIPGLSNQITFSTNINLGWNFLQKENMKQLINRYE